MGGAGTGGTGLGRRSELIRLGRGFGGLSGASIGSEKAEETGTRESESAFCESVFTGKHFA